MEIKWANVVAFGLAVATLYLVIKMRKSIWVFLQTMGDMSPHHTNEEKTWGLVAFALVAILLAGLIKILIENSHRD